MTRRLHLDRGLAAFLFVLGVALGARVLAEPVLLESAAMGTAGRLGGASVTTVQYLGWRFETHRPMAVDQVGGHMLSLPDRPGDVFAAIVRLDSLTAIPHGAPFNEDEVVATTLFRPNFPSDDYRTPLAATLTPGAYLLVFGTEMFGATGEASLPNGFDQPDIPPTDLSSFIFWSSPRPGEPLEWRFNLSSHMRFVLAGEVIRTLGDYNVDGVVDAADYDVWAAAFGNLGPHDADGNSDGQVDAADYTIWRDHLGESVAAASAALVPEPSTAIMAGALVLLLVGTAAPRQQAARAVCFEASDA